MDNYKKSQDTLLQEDLEGISKVISQQRRAFLELLKKHHKFRTDIIKITGLNTLLQSSYDSQDSVNDVNISIEELPPPTNFEIKLCHILNSEGSLVSVEKIQEFISLIKSCIRESDRAVSIEVVRNTLNGAYSKEFMKYFENKGGLSTIKSWVDEAFDRLQLDILYSLIILLKELPVALSSITKTKINETVVRMKKECPSKLIKRTSQELLKHWKSMFAEEQKASGKDTKSKSSSSKRSTDLSGTNNSTMTTSRKANTTDILGNLLRKPPTISKQTKDTKPTRRKVQEIQIPVPQKKVEHPITSSLPTIASFGNHGKTDNGVPKRKIRWADNEGKQLEHIKLIESWRDQVEHHVDSTFKDATLREHANEKLSFARERNSALQERAKKMRVIQPNKTWSTPTQILIPEEISSKKPSIKSKEYERQTNRTKHTMEMIVIGNEKNPDSGIEWKRTSEELSWRSPVVLPILVNGESDVDVSNQESHVQYDNQYYQSNTDGEDDIPEQLRRLDPETLQLVLDHEDIVKLVFDEARRGNITTNRIHEIVRTQSSKYNDNAEYQQSSFDRFSSSDSWQQTDNLSRKRSVSSATRRQPCSYFNTPAGCRLGSSCGFLHLDENSLAPATKRYKHGR